jgi:transposase-like protein
VPEDDAMADGNKSGTERKDLFGEHDRLELGIRDQVRTWIEQIVREELTAVLGAGSSLRVGESRRGYRHGTRERTLTTSLGPTTFTLPRARLFGEPGQTTEWHSTAVTRYQRRTC